MMACVNSCAVCLYMHVVLCVLALTFHDGVWHEQLCSTPVHACGALHACFEVPNRLKKWAAVQATGSWDAVLKPVIAAKKCVLYHGMFRQAHVILM